MLHNNQNKFEDSEKENRFTNNIVIENKKIFKKFIEDPFENYIQPDHQKIKKSTHQYQKYHRSFSFHSLQDSGYEGMQNNDSSDIFSL